MQQNDKAPGLIESGRAGVNLIVFAAQCVTRPLELLSTRPGSMGRRYVGSLTMCLGLLGFPFALAFLAQAAALPENFGAVPFVWMLLLFARLVHVVRAGRYRRHGHIHGFFEGLPLLSRPRWFGKYEQNVLFGGGVVVSLGALFECPVLIVYGMLAVLMFWIPRAWQEAHDEARVEAALDAEEDAAWLAGEVRRRRRTR